MSIRNRGRLAASDFSLTAVACAIAGLYGGAALAQNAPGSAAGNEKELEEVRVFGDRRDSFKVQNTQTGVFRDTPIIEVPLSVNVVPRGVMDAQAAGGLFDVLKNTPGVAKAQLGGSNYDNISIRGLLVENRGNYRLNGTMPIINLIDLPLENKERVEVLKGAAALYYGFVPPSGIVNMVTKRAGSEPVTSLMIKGNQYGELQTYADIGRRWGEDNQFGIRVNAGMGELRNAVNGFKGDKDLFSVAFDWRITPRWNVKVDYELINKKSVEQAGILVPTVNGKAVLPTKPDPTKLISGDWSRYDARADNLLVRSDYSVTDNIVWTIEAGHAITKRDRAFSQFEFNAPVATTLNSGAGLLRISPVKNQYYENTNFRTELAFTFETGPVKHELLTGYTSNQRYQNGSTDTARTIAQNLYNPGIVYPNTGTLAPTSAPSIIDDRGLYAFDKIALSEQWYANLGVRASRYSLTTGQRSDYSETTPAASLMYRPMRNLNLYASYLKGLEDGGQAPANVGNAFAILPPAQTRQYELGAKWEALPGLLLTGAYFDIDRNGAGVRDTSTTPNLFVTSGLANYKGFEFAATGELSREWSVYSTAMFMKARQVTAPASLASTVGRVPDNTAERTASVFAEYRPIWLGGWAFNAGLYYTGPRPVNASNDVFIPGYTTLDLGMRYRTRWEGKTITLQANLENATDLRYWSTAGNSLLAVGLPRTLKFSAVVDF
jgi:iron complex outermembrane receptor protein